MTRATLRKHHVVYRSTCIKTGRVFTGIYSTDDLHDGFTGRGTDLWRSIARHGEENHRYEVVQDYPTRELAKAALNATRPFVAAEKPKPPNVKKEKVVREKGYITGRRKHHIIYKTTCIITGKWYIGLHSTDDLNDGYIGSGTHLWRSIKKHGKHNHRTEILEHCSDRATLIKREAEIVTEDLLSQEACMNLMIGGNANAEEVKISTEERKRKNSEASKAMWAKRKADPVAMAEHIAKIATPEIAAKRAKSNSGKKRTTEQKRNLQAGQERYYSSADPARLKERGQKSAITRQERNTNKGGRPKGIPMSVAEKLKLGERMKVASPLSRRGVCTGCGKETTLVALNKYHAKCNQYANTDQRPNPSYHDVP